MKNKFYILIILISLSFVTLAKDKTIKEEKTVEVTVEADGDKVTKKVVVNGKELSPKEIEKFEASGQMKTLHLDHKGTKGKAYKVIMMENDEGAIDEDIEITVDTDGDKVTKKVIVNGKELSPQEIKEFEASGKMKVLHLDTDDRGKHGSKMIFVKSDSGSDDSDIDVEVIMDKIHEISDVSKHKNLKHSKEGKNVKIIKKEFLFDKDEGASLGVMAKVEDDGWHLTKIIEGSGAQNAGLLKGDLVIKIADVDLVKSTENNSGLVIDLPKFKEGEEVKVQAIRDGKTLDFNVIAKKLEKSNVFFSDKKDGNFEWIEKIQDNNDLLSDKVKVMVFNGDEGDFKLDTDDIHMLFPKDLGDMNIFVSDGKSTSKLLGKNHEMSSLSDELGKYFNTLGGVLVLHVDESNVFDLKDGDVIKSIDDFEVNTPKDVIKQLIKADKQEDIKLKIVRHKRNKTLKYKK